MSKSKRVKIVCSYCKENGSVFKRSLSGRPICKECFFERFESEIHETIIKEKLFNRGEKVVIGASGGKDSTVLIHIIDKLNRKYDYGIEIVLLSIDEGITGYRDDSLKTVMKNQEQYKLPLKVLSHENLFKGWNMDKIVKKTGSTNNCSFCGVFRRQALDRGAGLVKAEKMVTGHNADDMAETVLLNLFRGDYTRLRRCTKIITGEEGDMPRSKPFKYCFEREIVFYAHFQRLCYFTTECPYSAESFRIYLREFIKDLERIRPSALLDIVRSFEEIQIESSDKSSKTNLQKCERCGFKASRRICKACLLVEGLEKSVSKLSIGSKGTAKILNNKPTNIGW